MTELRSSSFVLLFLSLVLLVHTAAAQLTTQEELGQFLFEDTNLSEPAGQSCATCHAVGFAFTDPDQGVPTSQGVDPTLFGNRNTPTASYMMFSPDFYFDTIEELWLGGQFWDGRVPSLEEQAKGPFLNPVEMANASKAMVVDKIRNADYAPLFLQVYGPTALDDVEVAYDLMADAIAAFERTPLFAPFTSKYDYYLQGIVQLSPQELAGLAAFEGAGQCNLCHPSERGDQGEFPLFTDFSYDNLGVPRNPDNPWYTMPAQFNPDGPAWVDLGLGVTTNDPNENGKVKVPTLRNIAITGPYMHNGFFTDLREVVRFYSTRDTDPSWPAPEVAENVNVDELGNLGLTEQEIDDIVAFMATLTDGYDPGVVSITDDDTPTQQMSTDRLRVGNHPNPFNPGTTIFFESTRRAPVELAVFDAKGRRVKTLAADYYDAGSHSFVWNGTDAMGRQVASGLYFARVKTDLRVATHKMLLRK